eukprot:SAG22_NODE_141_length_17948_cov_129.932665_8_plen_91_part_00
MSPACGSGKVKTERPCTEGRRSSRPAARAEGERSRLQAAMASPAETTGMTTNAPVQGGSYGQKTINCVKALRDAPREQYHKYLRCAAGRA